MKERGAPYGPGPKWPTRALALFILCSLPLFFSEGGPSESVRAMGSSSSIVIHSETSGNHTETGIVVRDFTPFTTFLEAGQPAASFSFLNSFAFLKSAAHAETSDAFETFHLFEEDEATTAGVSYVGFSRTGSSLSYMETSISRHAGGSIGSYGPGLDHSSAQLASNQIATSGWGYLLPIAMPVRSSRQESFTRLTMPPLFTRALAVGEVVVDGIDYGDPNGIGVPLLHADGYETLQLSPHFRVADFATRDGAPLVRISPSLVSGLERLSALAGPIHIISGYRHKAHNAAVKGARHSRHISGQAADLWSPTSSSLVLARQAIEAMGCRIGLGLGRNSIHVDVRGTLATWTYPGAPLSEFAFDLWVRMLCSGRSFEPSMLAASVDWMVADSVDVDNDDLRRLDPQAWVNSMQPELAEYAVSAWYREGPGAVIIDFREGVPPVAEGISRVVQYARIRSAEVARFRLATIIDRLASHEPRRYFVYVALLDDGSSFQGLANLGGMAPPEIGNAEATNAGPDRWPTPRSEIAISPQRPEAGQATARDPVREQGAAPSSEEPGWTIVIASTTDPEEAEQKAVEFRRRLAETGLPVTYRVDLTSGSPRYRVIVGHFANAADARDAKTANAALLPRDAWLLPVGQ